jgi:HK97 gp10 family phage protein
VKNIKVTGGKELALALKNLPKQIERNIMRSALRAGAKVILDEAKQLVAVENGDLKKSLKVGTSSKKGTVRASVASKGKGSYISRFVEFGTAPHIISGRDGGNLVFTARDGSKITTKSVNHTGAKAKPFMRPALDGKSTQAIIAVGNKIRERLTEHGIKTPAPLEVGDE